MSRGFSERLLDWHECYGRKDLPWQRDPTPYRVWVSEIMLQQTQVATVVPYFERFMARFPVIEKLAAAPLDEVLGLWSGLGYYARGRNLHKAAAILVRAHAADFPKDIDAVQSLPGIGRSTAGAILALSRNQRHPILDGNVKRVLCRHHAIDGWPGASAVSRELWALAERLTPDRRVDEYTQAIMDLGATVCARARPACDACPVSADCLAREQGRQAKLPAPKPRPPLPIRSVQMIMVRNVDDRVLLERRPPTGIWGGLWGFPECSPDQEPKAWANEHLGIKIGTAVRWPTLRHTFSHFHLDIEPVVVRHRPGGVRIMEGPERVWYNSRQPPDRGLAAPVRRLLDMLQSKTEE